MEVEKNVYKIWKKLGETPLQALKNFRKKMSFDASIKMTYSGRLDPLAEGYLYILSHEAVHLKDLYNQKNKKYTVEVLMGFRTDTHDLLGLITDGLDKGRQSYRNSEDLDTGAIYVQIQKYLDLHIGKISQQYPAYSSKPVQGRPLFQWAREGKLDEIDIPKHDVIVQKNLLYQDIVAKEGIRLLSDIKEKISLVQGDFRQQQILAKWETEIDVKSFYVIFKIELETGPGFYVRQYVGDLSQVLSVPLVVFSICRDELSS